jgi:hypothetical protein
MSAQIQYEIVALQVEKMFAETIPLCDEAEINKRFNNIREFIESCGWSYEQYTDRMMGWDRSNQS